MAGKAVRNKYRAGHRSCSLVALLMVIFGIVFTSVTTLAASALEDLTNPLIGGIGGFFSGVEDDGETAAK